MVGSKALAWMNDRELAAWTQRLIYCRDFSMALLRRELTMPEIDQIRQDLESYMLVNKAAGQL